MAGGVETGAGVSVVGVLGVDALGVGALGVGTLGVDALGVGDAEAVAVSLLLPPPHPANAAARVPAAAPWMRRCRIAAFGIIVVGAWGGAARRRMAPRIRRQG